MDPSQLTNVIEPHIFCTAENFSRSSSSTTFLPTRHLRAILSIVLRPLKFTVLHRLSFSKLPSP